MNTAVQQVLGIGRRTVSTVIPSIRGRAWVRWLTFGVDALAVEVSLLFGVLIRQLFFAFFGGSEIGRQQYFGAAVGVLFLPLMNLFLEMYPGYGINAVERLRRRVYATIGVFGALMIWDYMVLRNEWSRGILLGALVFALIIPPLFESAIRSFLMHRGWWGAPVIVLGANETGSALIKLLNHQPELGMIPIAVLDDDPETWATNVEGVPVVGPTRRARALRYSAEVAVIAVPGLPRVQLIEWLRGLPFSKVVVIPDLSGMQTQGVRVLDFSGNLGLEIRKNLLVPRNQFLKKAMDRCMGIPLAIAAAPIIGLLALAVKFASRGPAFYWQERTGLNGKPIKVWKLRTMYQNSEELLRQHLENRPESRNQWLKHFKLKDDPRVVPVLGTFLRRTSLDELPQFFSVLRGEMSLVGPRPFPGYHLAHFTEDFQELRGSVRPGITGLWQVSERSNGDLVVQEKLDSYYIRNWSVWLDIYLLLRTFRAVATGAGAH